jgi:hypothetical protein
MDPQVIDQKLESLRRCLMRIESKQPFDAEQLADDFYRDDEQRVQREMARGNA